MNVLITGGAGYIGSVLTPTLLQAGHRVTVLDNFMFQQQSLADCCQYDTFEVVRGDCRDESLIKGLLREADLVIPLAALVGAPLCAKDPIAAETTNRDAVRTICRLATYGQRIMIVTNSGYGIGERNTFCTEETPLRPISLYRATKVEAEAAVLARDNSLTFRLAFRFWHVAAHAHGSAGK